jgi:hypothetical protein
MALSVDDYDKRTWEYAQSLERNSAELTEKIKRRCQNITLNESVALINAIIKGHRGAKFIKIIIYGFIMRDAYYETIYHEFSKGGWHVNYSFDNLIISNYAEGDRSPDYEAYSYEGATDRNNQIIFDFYHESADGVRTLEDLILFQHNIRVILYDLLVPKDKINK